MKANRVSKELIQIMLLAAVSDGKIDPEERQLLLTYQKLYPPLRDISQDESDEAKIDLFNKLNAEMKIIHIIENIGEKLSEKQKNTAYALAVEVCASNFEVVPQETALLEILAREWNIIPNIVSSVRMSVELRYQK